MSGIPREFAMLIDGARVPGSGAGLEVVNPATEEVVALAPDATDDQLQAAIDAAGRAFLTWRGVPLDERRTVLRRIGEALGEHTDELAALLTTEQGKPLAAARGELWHTVRWCEWAAAAEFVEEEIRDEGTHRLRVRHVPLGPVAAIVPWNFPVILAFWKIAPALLTGNTIVVKPSPFTPLTMLRIGEILRDLVPPGVVNVVTGGDSLGPKLTADPGIRKIAFTGSTATGKKVMESAARHLTRITLELGGNDAAIVLPDADLGTVADALFTACFRNSGQYCLGTKRVYVHEDIYDEFAERFAAVAAEVKVGNGMDDGVFMGPVQNRVQYEKVVGLIEDAERAGLDFLLKGEIPASAGYFIHPTIIDDPPEDSVIVTEEPFGPVVPLLRFRDIDDVVARVNASEYGLGGSVWSRDVGAAEAVAERIDSGVVWINESAVVFPTVPLAGHKSSGFGGENGTEGLMEYTTSQVISVRKA